MKLPTRQTIAGQGLDDVYDMVKTAIVKELQGIQVLCLMFDGWSDSQGLPFVGLRVGYITTEWEYKVVTLSCNIVHEHTAQNLSNHVRSQLEKFIGVESLKKMRLFTTHDGAANMVKASLMLKSEQFIHCVAHALHLLLVTDGLNRVPDLAELLRKCGEIVKKLHFKGCEMRQEEHNFKDISALADLMAKIQTVVTECDLDCQNPVTDNEGKTSSDMGEGEQDEKQATERTHNHTTLKKPIVTRWNSALHMIASIVDNMHAVDQVLLRCGLVDLKLQTDEKELLSELKDFLVPFEEYTQLVSSSAACLSLIVLIRNDIIKKTKPYTTDKSAPSIKALKNEIAKNVNRRLRVNDTIITATVMDPSTKAHATSLVTDVQLRPYLDHTSATSDQSTSAVDIKAAATRQYFADILTRKFDNIIHSHAVAIASSTASSPTSVGPRTGHSDDNVSTAHVSLAVATQTQAGVPVSKKLKMLEEMEVNSSASPATGTPDAERIQLLQEITSYLGPIRLSDAEKLSPLLFWKQNSHLYPRLSLIAKTYLTPSASSVPVESMFSTTGLIKNSRRASISPFRLNKVCFVHDNYGKFFPTE